MTYYRKRSSRYTNPLAHERREREERDNLRIERDKRRLARLLRIYRRIPVYNSEAKHAWNSPAIRTFSIGKTSDGNWINSIIRKSDRYLYLQEADYLGWKFFRLVPKHYIPRESELRRE